MTPGKAIIKIRELTSDPYELRLLRGLKKELKRAENSFSEYCGCGDWYDDSCEDAKRDLKKVEKTLNEFLKILMNEPISKRQDDHRIKELYQNCKTNQNQLR